MAQVAEVRGAPRHGALRIASHEGAAGALGLGATRVRPAAAARSRATLLRDATSTRPPKKARRGTVTYPANPPTPVSGEDPRLGGLGALGGVPLEY